MAKTVRADERLLAMGLADTPAMARALIMEGRVCAGARKITNASEKVRVDEGLTLAGKTKTYVSRGAHKLLRALEAFSIDVRGQTCIDVGASTGGFTDVLLRAGARKVYAVDVGYNQLDWRLRSDARVVCMERVNARFLTPDMFPEAPSFGATDVSFISLKAVLPAVARIMAPNVRFVALVKPQFEAPREDVGEKGVVRDPAVHRRVLIDIVAFVAAMGWQVRGLTYSPITGPEGNVEFLLDMDTGVHSAQFFDSATIDDTICQAYDKFFNL